MSADSWSMVAARFVHHCSVYTPNKPSKFELIDHDAERCRD